MYEADATDTPWTLVPDPMTSHKSQKDATTDEVKGPRLVRGAPRRGNGAVPAHKLAARHQGHKG